MKQVESPTTPSVQQPLAPATPTWSVAVSTDPYPSIRVSANTNSQKPSPGKDLRIGHAISRVEPVYPEDAKRQGIEGAVKLHVIVSRDGQVRKAELASGPALLAKAAMRAIRALLIPGEFKQTALAECFGDAVRNSRGCWDLAPSLD
jgi:TonB family protein